MGAIGSWFEDNFSWGSGLGTALGLVVGGPVGGLLGFLGGSLVDSATGNQNNVFDGGEDKMTGSLSEANSTDTSENGLSTSGDSSAAKDDGSSGVEESGNVGGEGAADAMSQQRATTAKSSLVGSGLPTFGFTEEGTGTPKVSKLGA